MHRLRLPILLYLPAILGIRTLPAQDPASPAAEVVIERAAVDLRDPALYQTALLLNPVRAMTVRALTHGTVASIVVKTGDKVSAQSELVRLESQESQLLFSRAQAAFQIAQLEEQIAADSGKPQREIAGQRVSMARTDLELAKLGLDRMVLKSLIAAEVYRIHVSAGTAVTPGMALLDIADPTQLVVEIPVDRSTVKVGDPYELTAEDRKVTGKVESILPAADSFSKLRELFVSVASARIVVDNSNGQLTPGQSVTSTFIPRHPILEAPNSSLVNTVDGGRKVQVLRDGFVRDLPIVLLGPVGETHSFVSGRFAVGDELITRSSVNLVDGTWVRPKLEVLQQTAPPAGSSPTPSTPARKPPVGL